MGGKGLLKQELPRGKDLGKKCQAVGGGKVLRHEEKKAGRKPCFPRGVSNRLVGVWRKRGKNKMR